MEDSYRHKGLRRKLIEDLRAMGISNESVLQAIDAVPRHFFMDSAFLNFAYNNKAFPIGAGQTISQPFTVAMQSSLLEIKKGSKILEVGTGSGYQTGVLCALGAKVFTIERQRSLFLKARKLLKSLGLEAYTTYGDGYKGIEGFAPYDGIIVTCGAPFIPKTLLKQMKIGAHLVIPIDSGSELQEMKRITKVADNQYEEESFGSFRFVPMLQKRADG